MTGGGPTEVESYFIPKKSQLQREKVQSIEYECETYLGSKQNIFLKKTPFSSQLGQANLISGSTDPTDPVFGESRKKKKTAQKFLYACKKS